ncbi:biotin-dependent carboxyltransferase family protein [Candidatus Pelagibacter sp.]|nr:biotin-dependent carboxyltransferase family protein [Candidatus Pelagibacter sp.]
MNEYFEVIRGGINSTFQDEGRKNFYHIGLPFSGVMDKRNFKILNTIIDNQIDDPVLEFAYQGPSLKYFGNKRCIVITGDVNFRIIKKDKKEISGKCYETIEIDNGDIVDIISTNKSVYGYFTVNGGFKINKVWESYATTVRAEVGPNKGSKLLSGQKIILNESNTLHNKSLNFVNSKIEFIRVIKGTNFEFFSDQSKSDFFSKEFLVTKLTDRMGMRLEGVKLNNLKKTNIKSEGLVKGTIQVPADGNPIILLSDHGTIGGYPKFGVVISADYDKLVQLPPGSKIKFKETLLKDAENLYKIYNMETNNILNKIK